MSEEKNKWARERSFWEINRGDFLAIGTAAMFLVLFVTSLVLVLGPWRLVPPIPGLTAPAEAPPPPTKPSVDQKFHYSVPGETEVLIYPGKPVILPPPPPEKPPAKPE